ncbi:hypothetical protein [Nocardioides ungokensis]
MLTDAGSVAAQDLAALADLAGAGVVVHLGDPKGVLRSSSTT